MVQKVIKYGNSLAVILPRESAASVGIDVGTLVETTVEGGRVVVQPVVVVPKLAPENQDFVDRLYKKRRRVFEALGE
ncbi:MAG TPA: AbrB/MazE/SpoVT family DNA-binding domain-containing protein [Phycisphaerae bacterium]|nr:AbrB/MazE/SpoVT family DNA-binding domain-containing protein [Phycisphaerae bacterium]